MTDRWVRRTVERSANRVLGASWASKPSSWLPRTYTSRAAAAENLRTLCGEPPSGSLGQLTAAIVEKGADGRLTIERQGSDDLPPSVRTTCCSARC